MISRTKERLSLHYCQSPFLIGFYSREYQTALPDWTASGGNIQPIPSAFNPRTGVGYVAYATISTAVSTLLAARIDTGVLLNSQLVSAREAVGLS